MIHMKTSLSHHFLVFVFVIPLFFLSCKKTVVNTTETELQSKLQELVNTNFAEYKKKFPAYPGGLVLKVLSPKGDFFAAAGMGDNITDQTHFRAASNTKTFTSTAILLLHQQGKLNVEHKITDTIPGSALTYVPATAAYDIPNKSSITILDLLRHRAGVFDVSNQEIPDTVSAPVPYKGKNYLEYVMLKDSLHTFTFDELVNTVAECKLSYFKPNTGYHYSNTGYSILGKIIERVSGKSYQQYLTNDIMKPMGMNNSSMPVLGTDVNLPAQFASGYIYANNSVVNVTASNISANVAEGNLITTPLELASFLKKLLTGKGVLNTYMVNSVMMNYKSSSDLNAGGYGCGLTYINHLGYGHTGAHEGYLSQMVYDPVSGFTAVAYTNAWNFQAGMTTLVEQLRDLLETTCYQSKAILN